MNFDFEEMVGEIETDSELIRNFNLEIGEAIIVHRRNFDRYQIYHYHQPERSKREDHESGCGALNIMET